MVETELTLHTDEWNRLTRLGIVKVRAMRALLGKTLTNDLFGRYVEGNSLRLGLASIGFTILALGETND